MSLEGRGGEGRGGEGRGGSEGERGGRGGREGEGGLLYKYCGAIIICITITSRIT